MFRAWEIREAPIGSTCAGNTADVEKCLQPVIPVCKDMNNYCSDPPVVIFLILKSRLTLQDCIQLSNPLISKTKVSYLINFRLKTKFSEYLCLIWIVGIPLNGRQFQKRSLNMSADKTLSIGTTIFTLITL